MQLKFDSFRFGSYLNPPPGREDQKFSFGIRFLSADRDANVPILDAAKRLVDEYEKGRDRSATPAQHRLAELTRQLDVARVALTKIDDDVKATSAKLETMWREGKSADDVEVELSRVEASRGVLTKKVKVLEDAVAVADRDALDSVNARDRDEKERKLSELKARSKELEERLAAVTNDVVVELASLTRAINTLNQ